MLDCSISFSDLMILCLDIAGNDTVSVVIDGSIPDRMLAKSAIALYGNCSVLWFTGNMFGLSKKSGFEL